MSIGIFGGTFDPVHLGHLALAKSAIQEVLLDKVVFVPNWIQPFKTGQAVTPGANRLAMLEKALAPYPTMAIDEVELNQERVSFTIDTMDYFRKANPNEDLYFLMGADAFFRIEEWKDASRLLQEYGFVIGSRPEYEDNQLRVLVREIQNRYGTRIRLLENPLFDVSSTRLRGMAEKGETLAGLVPSAVAEYIQENNVYNPEKRGEEALDGISVSRKNHILGVMDTAMKLAQRYGADIYKARTAALYHDYCKGLDNETTNQYIDQYHLDAKYKNQPQLSHGRIAAERVKREQGIVDKEVLDAIRYHTTGRKGMTLLEKIVYLSDAIEPTRNYPGVEKLRELAWVNIDEAVMKAMNQTISHVNKKGMELDMDTVEARDDLRKKIKEKVNE